MLKKFSNIAFALIAGLLVLTSCGSDDSDDQPASKTALETLTEALTASAGWKVSSESTSSAAGVTATDFTISSITVSDANKVSFTLGGGELSTYVSGGSFDLDANAAVSNPDVVGQTGYVVSGETVTATAERLTVAFDVAQDAGAARVQGVGSYSIVFTPN